MTKYQAYHLRIDSEICLPELIASNFGGFDLVIRTAAPDEIPVNFPHDNPNFFSADGNTFIKILSVGTFSIRQGREIIVAPEDGVDPNRLHLYLTGNIFAFLLLQRGYLVLHASAASVDGQAAAFLGTPGAGKSSLVAALYQLGHTILVDDVTAIDLDSDLASVIPAFPQVKLEIEAAKNLGIDPQKLILLHEDEEKRGFRFAERFPGDNQPLSKIYILSDQGDQIFQRISPQEAIVELIRNSYPTRFAQSGGAEHFLKCVGLVKKVPVFRMKKPPTLKDLPDFAALLADHILSIPS